jgi:Zinc knuckle
VIQRDRTIQEYVIELERLWENYDYFSPLASYNDPKCKSGEIRSQERTIQFLGNLNPAFDQRRAMLLAQTKIPSLEEAIATMMQEESHMKLHFDVNGSVKMRSTLVVSNSSMTRVQGETRKCYNCREVGHLSKVCPKPAQKRDIGGRGQNVGRGRGRGGHKVVEVVEVLILEATGQI